MKLIIACLIVAVLFFAIGYLVNEYKTKNDSEVKASNPVTYFEIPVTDMDRAMQFYGNVFGYSFTRQNIHGNDMAFFPFDESKPGITGAFGER